MMLCAKTSGITRPGASTAPASIVVCEPAVSAALRLTCQVIADDMTNGRSRHSGSTVVESIAPSFQRRSGWALVGRRQIVGPGIPPAHYLDRPGIPLCFLTHGKQNHNAILTPTCGSNHLQFSVGSLAFLRFNEFTGLAQSPSFAQQLLSPRGSMAPTVRLFYAAVSVT